MTLSVLLIAIFLIVLAVKRSKNQKLEKETNSLADLGNMKISKLKRKISVFKTLTIIQGVITILFFGALITDLVTQADNIEGSIYVNILTIGILIPLCITYFKSKKMLKKIETYQDLVMIRNMYDVQKISNHLGISKMKALDSISYMIKEGYLNLEIHDDKIFKPKEHIDPEKIFSVICQSCGATNRYIKDKNNKCEYCGNVLNISKV